MCLESCCWPSFLDHNVKLQIKCKTCLEDEHTPVLRRPATWLVMHLTEMFPFHGKLQCGNKMVQHFPTPARRKEPLLLDFCQKSHRLSVTLFLCDYTSCYLIGLTSNRRGSQIPKQFCVKPTMVDWVAFTLLHSLQLTWPLKING